MISSALQIVSRFWFLGALAAWAAALLGFGVIRLDTFGLDEGAARALLLNWSVADNIINPVLTMGPPDFRALLFVPVGIYWSGNMLAAKLLGLGLAFFAVSLLYRWASRLIGSEAAMVASALLLVSPVLIAQIDSMGIGTYLLLGFALGVWLDTSYRAKPGYFGGWYFCQVLWMAVLITLHPMALAYPIALVWRWLKNPDEHKTARHMYVGIGLATTLALVVTRGWHDIAWLENPIKTLGNATMGGIVMGAGDTRWIAGTLIAAAAVWLGIVERKKLATDFGGQMLVLGLLIGCVAADGAWATLVVALVLYFGTARLIGLGQISGKRNFLGQRGVVTIVAFSMSTWFMLEAKTHAAAITLEILSPQDELIRLLGEEASHKDRPFRAASQWPGRSMLVCRRDVFPLPPAYDDPEDLRKALKGLTHVIFDPLDKKNKALADKFSAVAEETETMSLQKGGVLLAIRGNNVKMETRAPPTTTTTEQPPAPRPEGGLP